MLFFAVFLSLLVLVMPKFIQYWWGCKPIEASEKGKHLAAFLKQKGSATAACSTGPFSKGE
jgi:hypothetical protein